MVALKTTATQAALPTARGMLAFVKLRFNK